MVSRQQNILIFQDTVQKTATMYNPFAGEYKVDTRYYFGDLKNEECLEKTPITMVSDGTVSTGYIESRNGGRVAILNFADALQAGGLVDYGEYTQEENICRCTNLYPVLCSPVSQQSYYIPNKKYTDGNRDAVYLDNIIYARDITIFKDDVTYMGVPPVRVDVITCPAPSVYIGDKEKAYGIYRKRTEQIVLSAIDNQADVIVLGAWGCGAFGQDPVAVSTAFAETLNEYSGYFSKIVFAIKPTHGESNDMYKIFEKTFQLNYEGGLLYE